MRVFFDNSATTPLDPAVVQVMTEAMLRENGNASSIYAEGRTARASIERARKTVAKYLNASIGEIFFTSGGTESSNMALKCSVRDLGVERIISSRTEHHCVLHTLDTIDRTSGTEILYVDQFENGLIDYRHLEQLLREGKKKTLVSLMHANNEIGAMLDLDLVSALCRQYGAFFHSDTVQTVGYYPIDLNKTQLSFITGSAHKFHGPKGVGFIYINNANMIRPYMDGGSQERNMRGGTENNYGILGLAKAMEMAYEYLEQRQEHIRSLRDYLARELQARFSDLEFNGDPFGQGHYKLLSVGFPPSPRAELMLLNLDIAGVSVSGGSACSSGAEAGSHVLDTLKKNSPRKTIRFSLSHLNTKEEVDFVLKKLGEVLP